MPEISFSLGLFVGGSSSRMGGFPKGLLPHPQGKKLVEYALDLAQSLKIQAFLVGSHPAYDFLEIPSIPDLRPGCGPLSGLISLLQLAPSSHVIALAVDMPFVSTSLLQQLMSMSCASDWAVIPRLDHHLQPLCACYNRVHILPSLQEAFDQNQWSITRALSSIPITIFDVSPEQQSCFQDWDCPDDISQP